METDVCVIGAGFAGLTAARRLIQGGREAVVLEARDRVGGRVWTTSSEGGIPIDRGVAAFLSVRWVRQGSNLRPLACKASALAN